MDKLKHINFAFTAGGGWVKANLLRESGREQSAWVRFEEVKRRKHSDGRPVWRIAELQVKSPTAEALREIPLQRLEVAFNGLEMSAELLDTIDEVPSADLDSAISGRFNRQSPRKKFQRPASRRLNDEFFAQVAAAYREAVIRGLDPGKTLAEDADVPHSTAARWIAVAREKRYLPKTRPGKVQV